MPIRKKADADASLNTIPDDSADSSLPKETSEAERLHSRLQELLHKTPKQEPEATEPDKTENTEPTAPEETNGPSLMNADVFDELITENNGIAPSVSELENLMNQQQPQPVEVPEGATQIIRRVADVPDVAAGTEVMPVMDTDLVREDLPPVERLTIDPNRKLSWSEKRELKRQRKEDKINAHPVRHAFFVLFMTLITIVVVISGSVVGSYIGYLQYTYEPYEDEETLSVSRPKTWYVSTKTNYNVMIYNIGNGVHTPEYSDFRSEGKLKNGTSLSGEQVRAISSTDVATNIAGISEVAKKEDCEFYMFQDVDIASTRSSMIDQTELLTSLFAKYSRTLAKNMHTRYAFYPVWPIGNQLGVQTSGLMTLSTYRIGMAIRKSMPSTEDFFNKFISFDNCMNVSYVPVRKTTNYLVMINVQMEAFEDEPEKRAEQIRILNEFIEAEYNDGNYIIIGGDFQQDIANSRTAFAGQHEIPSFVNALTDSQLNEHFSLVTPSNAIDTATCRYDDMPYADGTSYEWICDGFIISDNISATAKIIDTNYAYSDHNPVKLTFKLNAK